MVTVDQTFQSLKSWLGCTAEFQMSDVLGIFFFFFSSVSWNAFSLFQGTFTVVSNGQKQESSFLARHLWCHINTQLSEGLIEKDRRELLSINGMAHNRPQSLSSTQYYSWGYLVTLFHKYPQSHGVLNTQKVSDISLSITSEFTRIVDKSLVGPNHCFTSYN